MDDFIKQLMKHHDIPGVSLAVVHKGSVICTSGYGVLLDYDGSKNAAKSNQVNSKTGFCIGSLTKAFTSAIWASILQNEKGMDWDTPLSRLVKGAPIFCDDFRTDRTTLRDILSHKMGIELGEGDFSWMCDAFPSTYHLIKNAKYLPCAVDFRTKMIYNNYMYAIAGYLSDLARGESWESLVQNLFDLLGMEDAGFIHQLKTQTKLAHPHMSVDGHSIPLDLTVHKCIGKLAACGSIFASAEDMAKWMLFHLNKGRVGDAEIIKSRWLEECHKPSFALPQGKPEWSGYVRKPLFPVTETRDGYGFGWWTGTYREYRTVAHAGELFGYDSLLTLLPDANFGVYTCLNGPGGEAAHVTNQLIQYYIIDQLLSLTPWLTAEKAITFPQPWSNNRQLYFPQKVRSTINSNIKSKRPLLCFRGTYNHPFLGDIEISLPKAHTTLKMTYGRNGKFILHPNGEEDEFRIEGLDCLQFVHQVDLYSPSDWMTVHFNFSDSTDERASFLHCSFFESAPEFRRID